MKSVYIEVDEKWSQSQVFFITAVCSFMNYGPIKSNKDNKVGYDLGVATL